MAWTLQVNAGAEKALAAWGVTMDDFQLKRSNQTPDVLSLRVASAMDATPLAAYGDTVTVRRDRAGSGTSWSDGSIYFVGRQTAMDRDGRPGSEAIIYRVSGPWWELQQQVFQQQRAATVSLTPTFTSVLFLCQKSDGTPQTTSEQLEEILSYAADCGCNLQVGDIDDGINIPIYQVRDLMCAEAATQMLRWTPDFTVWFDYTTTPPTINARKLANLTSKTVTLGTEKFRSLRLRPRHDLQLSNVVLHFEFLNNVDGVAIKTIDDQVYPPGSTGRELGATVMTIDLAGVSRTTVSTKVTTEVIDAANATEANRIAWWKKKDPTLRSEYIGGISIDLPNSSPRSHDITDSAGTDVTLADFPTELISGQITNFVLNDDDVPASTKDIVIKARATFEVYADTAHKIIVAFQQVKELSVRVKATDLAELTDEVFTAVTSEDPGETIPEGLAQAIFDASSVLQYEGSVPLVAEEIPSDLGMGNRLTIAGTDLTLASQLIQEVTEEPGSGRMTLEIGPARQLGIADRIENLRNNRYRWIRERPASRVDAVGGSGQEVALGEHTADQNTTHTDNTSQLQAVNYPIDGTFSHQVIFSAASQKIVIRKITNDDGNEASGSPKIEINIADLTGTNKVALLRELLVCDRDSGDQVLQWFLCTEPEALA